MKKVILFSILLLQLWSPELFAQNSTTKLEVIYFHATRRCPTCNAIEQNTKKTLELYFAAQVKSGVIKISVVNVDEKQNEALAEKYEATGSSLFLTKTVNGTESRIDMTDFAFSYARNNPEKFKTGLRDKINELLK